MKLHSGSVRKHKTRTEVGEIARAKNKKKSPQGLLWDWDLEWIEILLNTEEAYLEKPKTRQAPQGADEISSLGKRIETKPGMTEQRWR